MAELHDTIAHVLAGGFGIFAERCQLCANLKENEMTENATEEPAEVETEEEDKFAVDVDFDSPYDAPIERLMFDFSGAVTDVETVGEAVNLMMARMGTYGLNAFAITLSDADNQDRKWVLYDGEILAPEVFIARIEAEADEG